MGDVYTGLNKRGDKRRDDQINSERKRGRESGLRSSFKVNVLLLLM